MAWLSGEGLGVVRAGVVPYHFSGLADSGG